jgi:hypothetical protein
LLLIGQQLEPGRCVTTPGRQLRIVVEWDSEGIDGVRVDIASRSDHHDRDPPLRSLFRRARRCTASSASVLSEPPAPAIAEAA